MFFGIVFASFDVFSAKITLYKPFVNYTEIAYVTQNATRQYYGVINTTNQIAMSRYTGTMNNKSFSYYLRSVIDKIQCLPLDYSERRDYVPNLSIFDGPVSVVYDGRKMNKYTYTYIRGPDYNSSTEFLDLTTCQQDFYVWNGKPYRWDIWGAGDYQYYLYENYTTQVNESLFVIPDECNQSQPVQTNINKENSNNNNLESNMKKIYSDNMQKIIDIQKDKTKHFTVSPNKFVFMTKQQQKAIIKGYKPSKKQDIQRIALPIDFNFVSRPSFSWRLQGTLTPVRDQGNCGSCWSFGVIGTVEGRINADRIKQNRSLYPIHLAEQQLVDCYWDVYNDGGCEGNDPYYVATQLANDSKLTLRATYPYIGISNMCKQTQPTYDEYTITSVNKLQQDVNQLKQALKDGPVTVGVNVPDSFMYYSGGIYDDPNCVYGIDFLDHAVTLVGWGTDDEVGEYWIVRNSWGRNWGSDGYIYIKIEGNICGVTTDAIYVDVEKQQK